MVDVFNSCTSCIESCISNEDHEEDNLNVNMTPSPCPTASPMVSTRKEETLQAVEEIQGYSYNTATYLLFT